MIQTAISLDWITIVGICVVVVCISYPPLRELYFAPDNHLVANLVILHNVDAMSKAINKLKPQGFQVDAEALSSLSPYRTEHINLLGTYSLNIPKKAE